MEGTSYLDLKKQIADLEKLAEAARLVEMDAAITEVRAMVAEYRMTEQDVFGRQRGARKTSTRGTVPVKYRKPETGEEWTGRGRAPHWIAKVPNRDIYLVEKDNDNGAA